MDVDDGGYSRLLRLSYCIIMNRISRVPLRLEEEEVHSRHPAHHPPRGWWWLVVLSSLLFPPVVTHWLCVLFSASVFLFSWLAQVVTLSHRILLTAVITGGSGFLGGGPEEQIS